MANNSDILRDAKKNKNDEFYTKLSYIEDELSNYTTFFKDKIVYCNCDTKGSNFYIYFKNNFEALQLKKLVRSNYNPDGNGTVSLYLGDNQELNSTLSGNGSFDSDECLTLLDKVDVVVTNIPFSLYRHFVPLMFERNKYFLIIGNHNAVTYKEIFPLIQENKMWLGVNSNKVMEFYLPDDYEKWDHLEDGVKVGKVPAISWFTNIPFDRKIKPIKLTKTYNETDYPKYDNLDAIEVSKTTDIPIDYQGLIEVPISFLTKYCPDQFDIMGLDRYIEGNKYPNKRMFIDGKEVYARIIIKYKHISDGK